MKLVFLLLVSLYLIDSSVQVLPVAQKEALIDLADAWAQVTIGSYAWNMSDIDSACVEPGWRGVICRSEAGTSDILSINFEFSAKLDGSIPDSIGNLSNLQYLKLPEVNLSGTIPGSLASLERLKYLDLAGNNLSGTVPAMSSLVSLTYLNLSNNQLRLCESPVALPPSLSPSTCDISRQSAPMKCGCPNPHANCTFRPDVCNPSRCVGRSPGQDFVCKGKFWIAENGFTVESILSIDGPTIIEGNFSLPSSSSIQINSTEGSIVVNGCVDLKGRIRYSLTSEQAGELKDSSFNIISGDPACFDISENILNLEVPAKSCKRVETGAVQTPSSLLVVFSVNSIRCKVWWISLIAVVSGVLLVVTIIAVVHIMTRKSRTPTIDARRRAEGNSPNNTPQASPRILVAK